MAIDLQHSLPFRGPRKITRSITLPGEWWDEIERRAAEGGLTTSEFARGILGRALLDDRCAAE